MVIKGTIEIQNARQIGTDSLGRTMYMGKYKHPRKEFMEEVATIEIEEGKNILTVGGNDKLAGKYEVILK